MLRITSTVALNNGVKMPLFGLGTYELQSADMDKIITSAIVDNGYIHIDTASAYRNEEAIGAALKKIFQQGKIKREDIFITSKANTREHGEKAYDACMGSLQRLGIDYLDLYLIHWPGVAGTAIQSPENSKIREQTWRAFEKLYQDKKCRSIGVSNYTVAHLEELISKSSIVPAVNQVEFHPFLYQKELLDFCNKHGIVLEAYASLTRAKKMDDDKITEIAKTLGKTRSQVLLRWAIQKNIPVIPKSSQIDRIKENANIFDFEIPQDIMNQLDSINDGNDPVRICWDPNTIL
ncbi:hypothetical protein CYY_001930 [Polysphondylium violaceum]|uniref:NADP-dependent oxidoreductase domain-containing protein n=1 Tax=Polysphondylium violaceum TaxID=133409 RepID=A0A8J4UVN6_9MYCE|nr:hypothetical protein CYY_001930 [Polysphondylium violaceum]